MTMKTIGRFFVASFIFTVAFLYDWFHGNMTRTNFDNAWPMYPRYVRTGKWREEEK